MKIALFIVLLIWFPSLYGQEYIQHSQAGVWQDRFRGTIHLSGSCSSKESFSYPNNFRVYAWESVQMHQTKRVLRGEIDEQGRFVITHRGPQDYTLKLFAITGSLGSEVERHVFSVIVGAHITEPDIAFSVTCEEIGGSLAR